MEISINRMSREQRAPWKSRRQADRELVGTVSWTAAALDQLNQGIALLDARRRIRFSNRMARTILAAADGLRANGRELTAIAASDALLLARAIERAISHGQHTSLRLRRPAARRPLALLIAPLTSHEEWPTVTDPVVLVTIAVPDRAVAPSVERLTQTYDLTEAEARVARRLLLGSDIADTAVHLNICRETARTHLRRILAKTGTHRQSELIRLLLQEVGGVV